MCSTTLHCSFKSAILHCTHNYCNVGTNDALNAPSDGQCLLNADRYLRNIERNHSRSHPSIRSFDGICSTSYIFKKKPATCRDAESPLQRCEDSHHLHFVETGCSARDLTEDGVHLIRKVVKLKLPTPFYNRFGISASPFSSKSFALRKHQTLIYKDNYVTLNNLMKK